jgi:hypothetical protein
MMQKFFSCCIDGWCNVTITKADTIIMMEKAALYQISKILMSNKRGANEGEDGPAPKQ